MHMALLQHEYDHACRMITVTRLRVEKTGRQAVYGAAKAKQLGLATVLLLSSYMPTVLGCQLSPAVCNDS